MKSCERTDYTLDPSDESRSSLSENDSKVDAGDASHQPQHLQVLSYHSRRKPDCARGRMTRRSRAVALSWVLLAASFYQCESEVVGATGLDARGRAARSGDLQRERIVSAAALVAAGSMMINAAADEGRHGQSLTQSLLPTNELSFENSDESNVIGDGVRSAESSSHFFQSIDTDGDGTLDAPELADVVRQYIDEASFGTGGVEDEVSRVMKKLDRNDEEGVDSSDVFAHWMQLESLLTVNEVAEWVVYAVQMPDYMGKVFRDNFVTGYDFPELAENGGEALLSELKIEKPSFRKRLVKHVYARLLGIGSVPTPPSDVKYQLESCSTVSFSWGKSSAVGFPVHSYRVQRRAVVLYRGDSPEIHDDLVAARDVDHAGNDLCMEDELSPTDVVCPVRTDGTSSSDWVTMYVGGETDYIDTGLEPGKNYQYRFQAWNSVGRSPWITVDISRSLKKQKCHWHKSYVSQNRNWTSNETSVLGFLFWGGGTLLNGSYAILQFLLTGLAVASAVMRFRRASVKSTAVAGTEGVSPSLWTGLNSFFARVLGVELVPSSELGEHSSLHQSKNAHDRSVNAVGLNGYSNTPKADPNGRRLAFQKRHTASDVALTESAHGSTRQFKNASFRINRSMRNGLVSMEGSPDVVVAHGTQSVSSRDSSPFRVSRESSVNSQDSSDSGCDCEMEDDDSRCNSCQKRYKFGKRWRHHCARCMSTFCHKHGRTTHTNLTSCKVPGNCICNVCLEMEQFDQKESSPNGVPKSGKRWLSRRQRSSDCGGNQLVDVQEEGPHSYKLK